MVVMGLGRIGGHSHWINIGGAPFNPIFYEYGCDRSSLIVILHFQPHLEEIMKLRFNLQRQSPYSLCRIVMER
jgi:hypothetical protein